jgi:hypothetical protein
MGSSVLIFGLAYQGKDIYCVFIYIHLQSIVA